MGTKRAMQIPTWCAGFGLLILLAGCEPSAEPPPASIERAPAHEYSPATVRRFEALLETPGWHAADPGRNVEGLLRAEHDATGLTFVLIPEGMFRMGSSGGNPEEKPVHQVVLPAFLLSRSECSQEAWDRVGGEDRREWDKPDLPIDRVSWDDAASWCAKAGLRLPSEAEWEYACRAGGTGDWTFGDDEAVLPEYAWFAGNAGGRSRTCMGREANAWGLHDMHGNEMEWVRDTWHPGYEGAPADGRAWIEEGATTRVYRGGSWGSKADSCRSAHRSAAESTQRKPWNGFRPAASLP